MVCNVPVSCKANGVGNHLGAWLGNIRILPILSHTTWYAMSLYLVKLMSWEPFLGVARQYSNFTYTVTYHVVCNVPVSCKANGVGNHLGAWLGNIRILPILSHTTWYAMSQYLVKLMELGTIFGRG